MQGFAWFLYKQFTTKPKVLPKDLDLSEQVAIVTGAGGGLGLEAAKDLASRHIGRIILCARSIKNGELARQQVLQSNVTCNVDLWIVDYEDYGSLLECGKKASGLERLDIVIPNAGVRQLKYRASPTGHEEDLQVNHIGKVLLSLLLYPALSRTAGQISKSARLTIVSSVVHCWTPFKEHTSASILAGMDEDSMRDCPEYERYHTSKLLNILWMRQLADR